MNQVLCQNLFHVSFLADFVFHFEVMVMKALDIQNETYINFVLFFYQDVEILIQLSISAVMVSYVDDLAFI